mgnify:CR=1 FL=1
MKPTHVMDGYRVLDLSQYLAGPAATNVPFPLLTKSTAVPILFSKIVAKRVFAWI